MKTKLYARLADLVVARNNCIASGNSEWKMKHEDAVSKLVSNHMPSGSGFDDGCHIDLTGSNSNRLVFYTSFHHMDENGYYTGWTEHCVRVYPTFGGVRMTITGENKNDIKNYIYESFDIVLDTEVEY